MLVHRMRAVEELAEFFRADGDHQRQADGGPDGVTSANPVPETENAVAVDPEGGDLVERGGHCAEVMLDGLFTQRIGNELAGSRRIRHRLDGGEGLGSDDEERRFRVDQLQRVGNVSAIDVGDEMRAGTVMERRKSKRCHDWAKIRATNANIDDVGDLLAGCALERAGADRIGKLAHGGKNVVHIRHHVLAVDEHGRVRTVAKSGMENSAPFGEIDLLAGEHLFALLRHAAFGRELFKQRQNVVIHGAFGVIHQKVVEARAEPFEALTVCSESASNVRRVGAGGCGFQGLDDGLHGKLLMLRGRMRKLFSFIGPNQGVFG